MKTRRPQHRVFLRVFSSDLLSSSFLQRSQLLFGRFGPLRIQRAPEVSKGRSPRSKQGLAPVSTSTFDSAGSLACLSSTEPCPTAGHGWERQTSSHRSRTRRRPSQRSTASNATSSPPSFVRPTSPTPRSFTRSDSSLKCWHTTLQRYARLPADPQSSVLIGTQIKTHPRSSSTVGLAALDAARFDPRPLPHFSPPLVPSRLGCSNDVELRSSYRKVRLSFGRGRGLGWTELMACWVCASFVYRPTSTHGQLPSNLHKLRYPHRLSQRRISRLPCPLGRLSPFRLPSFHLAFHLATEGSRISSATQRLTPCAGRTTGGGMGGERKDLASRICWPPSRHAGRAEAQILGQTTSYAVDQEESQSGSATAAVLGRGVLRGRSFVSRRPNGSERRLRRLPSYRAHQGCSFQSFDPSPPFERRQLVPLDGNLDLRNRRWLLVLRPLSALAARGVLPQLLFLPTSLGPISSDFPLPLPRLSPFSNHLRKRSRLHLSPRHHPLAPIHFSLSRINSSFDPLFLPLDRPSRLAPSGTRTESQRNRVPLPPFSNRQLLFSHHRHTSFPSSGTYSTFTPFLLLQTPPCSRTPTLAIKQQRHLPRHLLLPCRRKLAHLYNFGIPKHHRTLSPHSPRIDLLAPHHRCRPRLERPQSPRGAELAQLPWDGVRDAPESWRDDFGTDEQRPSSGGSHVAGRHAAVDGD